MAEPRLAENPRFHAAISIGISPLLVGLNYWVVWVVDRWHPVLTVLAGVLLVGGVAQLIIGEPVKSNRMASWIVMVVGVALGVAGNRLLFGQWF